MIYLVSVSRCIPIYTSSFLTDVQSIWLPDITSIYEKLYPIEKYTGYNPLTAHWLPLAFSNAALLHVILACSDSFIAESWNPRIRPIAIKHLNAAICVVNENISAQPLVVSDETIVVVSTMAIIEVRYNLL